MITISFDVMGNDNGVKGAVKASMKFIKANPNYKIILVGSENDINKYLKPTKGIEILNVPKIVDLKKGAMIIRDKDNSMYKSIELVKDKKADAVLSSGSSAAYIAYSTFNFKKLKGVSRPGFMPIFPTIIPEQKFIMMDVGATLEADENLLYSWAKLGKVFSHKVLGVKNPKVAILNIGTEENKGLKHHTKTYKLLKDNKSINFIGYVESRELLNYAADVIVTDGYAGNICLKSIEGTALSISRLLKKNIMKNPIRILSYLLFKGVFKSLNSTLDFRNTGGAWVMGVDAMVVKTHGSADMKSFMGALKLIKEAIKVESLKKIKEVLK
ncbi:MAG: phosphate acyltransferase PlsX [Mycoplasma sp.]|nr:phosphate acyltransferase PlsX [Mycoplasma sp.]